MKIALDYDETYTDAPELFKLFVFAAQHQGHKVSFVTYRDSRGDNNDIKRDAKTLGIDIIYTAGRQKQHVFNADIWIDDNPVTIPRAIDLGNMYDGCLVNNDME